MMKKAAIVTVSLLLVFLIFVYYDSIEDFIMLHFLVPWGLLRSPQPDFEISADPVSIMLNGWEGSQNRTVITVKSLDGFSDNITFEVKQYGIIGDVTFTFDHPQISLPADGQVQCILTLHVQSVASPGKYSIDIIGTASDSTQHSIRIALTILVYK